MGGGLSVLGAEFVVRVVVASWQEVQVAFEEVQPCQKHLRCHPK